MREARLIEVTELAPDMVAVERRLRPVSAAAVQSVIASVNELGLLKDEIIVRRVRHQDNRLVLVAGAHRLEAFRRMGRKVPAKIYDCSDDWARLMELDDNLAGAELGALDSAVFLAARKRIYERLHPETRAGVAGALHRWDTTDMMSVASFTTTTAEKFGISKRHVERLVAAGSSLSPKEVDALRAALRPVGLSDLAEIGKIGEPGERGHVVAALASGEVKNALAARKAYWAGINGVVVPVTDPIEVAFTELLSRYRSAPKLARRRFVRAAHRELRALLEDLDEGGGHELD